MRFTCPECGMTSYNPNDARFGYCGNCQAFTGEQLSIIPPPSPPPPLPKENNAKDA